jgi:hypothetical protein
MTVEQLLWGIKYVETLMAHGWEKDDAMDDCIMTMNELEPDYANDSPEDAAVESINGWNESYDYSMHGIPH